MTQEAYFPDILIKFLGQADAPKVDLKTKHYKGFFKGLKIKASFGAGNAAKIPWLALLRDTQEVSKGIYPVYLYYKEHRLLILAYGISEENEPDVYWDLSEQTVKDFLETEYSTTPDRYGSSLVFRHYKIDRHKTNYGLSLKQINYDIHQLAEIYNHVDLGYEIVTQKTKSKRNSTPTHKLMPFSHEKFLTDIKQIQLNFTNEHVLRFIASLCTKPFVILTGLSGSGKTKLAQAFSKWICAEEKQVCMVPVGADWTNREPLLGFPSALEKGEYVFPENGALNLILAALEDEKRPYFLILDEMNLSHVERYFADFLSAMESGEAISLHSGDHEHNNKLNQTAHKIPANIKLPPNLFIVGTVNIDETTYMFSPKVLDRANVIEFRVTRNEMESYLSNGNNNLNMQQLKTAGKEMAESFVELASDKNLSVKDRVILKDELLLFFDVLNKIGAEFGFRSAAEIMRFAAIMNKFNVGWGINKVIDAIAIQKLLPRVHGSRRKLEPVLRELATICLFAGAKIDNYLGTQESLKEDSDKIKYLWTLEKIRRMYQRLLDNGFTSYAEA